MQEKVSTIYAIELLYKSIYSSWYAVPITPDISTSTSQQTHGTV